MFASVARTPSERHRVAPSHSSALARQLEVRLLVIDEIRSLRSGTYREVPHSDLAE
jgi:hypothetical protein